MACCNKGKSGERAGEGQRHRVNIVKADREKSSPDNGGKQGKMDKKEDICQKPMPQRSGNTGQGKYLPDPLKEMKKKKQGETTSKAEVYEEQAPAEKDFLVSLDNLDNF